MANYDRAIAICAMAVLWTIVLVSLALAQDVTVVPIPTGISPVLQWVMGVLGIVATTFLPLIALWFKQHMNVQDAQARSGMINGAVVRAAHLADVEITQQHLTPAQSGIGTPTMNKAVEFVGASYPDAINATPQADDEHIAQMIQAELHKLELAKAENVVPSVVLSPVSALR